MYGSRSSTSQLASTGPRASSLANTCGTLPGAPCDAADIQNRSRRVALTFTSTSVPSRCQVPVSQVENEGRAGRSGRSPARRPDVAGCSTSARSSSGQTPGSSRSRRRSCDHHGTGESSHTSSAATRLASPACPPGATELPETPGSGSCPRPSPRPGELQLPAGHPLAACGSGFCAPGRGRRGHAGVMGSCSSVTHLSGSSGHSRVSSRTCPLLR